jgi:hypothetical protein
MISDPKINILKCLLLKFLKLKGLLMISIYTREKIDVDFF